jgi:DNA polymerase III alpha subunit
METLINSSTSTEQDVCQAIILHGLDVLKYCVVDQKTLQKYVNRLDLEKINYPVPKSAVNEDNWFIPDEYKNMDIEKFLIEQCPIQNHERLATELKLFKEHDMTMVLKSMKYLIDTMRSNGIVWGVGRGSSVASYALFLIGVHKIDPIKYNLSINEFFKGE